MLLKLAHIQTTISVEFLDLELNPPWEPNDFLIPVPPGATVVPWP
jgi:outer membrane lipoprotein-sorting protein